jgi:hypothetical protein
MWPPPCEAPTVFPLLVEVKAAIAEPILAELLIDCEEDRTFRAVLVGMLREGDRSRSAGSSSPEPPPRPLVPRSRDAVGLVIVPEVFLDRLQVFLLGSLIVRQLRTAASELAHERRLTP